MNKKPISKTRQVQLKRFLADPSTPNSHLDFWHGMLPHTTKHPQGVNYWVNKYYGVYCRTFPTAINIYPKAEFPNEEDMSYIKSLLPVVDTFLLDERNKGYLVE